MTHPVFAGFAHEWEKRAVSAGSTLRLLQARAAQGVRIAPRLMQGAEQAAASGLARTAPGTRALALEAGQAARAQQATQSAAALKAPLQGRLQAAEGANMYSNTPLKTHEGYMGATNAYSPQYRAAVAPQGGIADPRGLLSPPPAPMATAPTEMAGTVVAKRRRV